MLLVTSPEGAALRHALPALGDLPCLALAADPSDSRYPPLGWQLPALRAAAARLLAAPRALAGRLEAARYAHLPLSAVGGDWVIDAADALFARLLREGGHVLWAGDEGQPRLAARPEDLADAAARREQSHRLEVRGRGSLGIP